MNEVTEVARHQVPGNPGLALQVMSDGTVWLLAGWDEITRVRVDSPASLRQELEAAEGVARRVRAARDKGVAAPVAVKLYHFTSEHHLPQIMADGFLKLTESNCSFTREHAGPDVVWLTADPLRATQGEWALRNPRRMGAALFRSAVDKTAVRITVEAPGAVRWIDWARARGVDPLVKQALIEAGGGLAVARHWHVSEEPVSMEGAVVERLGEAP